MNKPDYLAIANQYISDVLRGKVKACKYVKQACQRQRDDLKRKRFEYHFDETKATRICWFIENLTHVKGELAGKRIHLEPWQVFILTTVFGWVDADGFRRFRRSYIEVPRGNGKALSLDTEIPTPNGFVRMGDLKVGDVVFGTNGKPCRITGATDVMLDRPCYEVEFSTGEVIIADANHQWVTDSRRDRDRLKGRGNKNIGPKPSIKTTKEISETLWCRKERNHRVAIATAFDVSRRDLPLDPYVLGLWIGDGTSSGCGFTCAEKDAETIDRIRAAGFPVHKVAGQDHWAITSGSKGAYYDKNSFHAKLKSLDEIGNKHIPVEYLFASREQRLELLRGLMDTDGFISSGQGQCEFVQKNKGIAFDVYALISSLGYRPRIMEKVAKIGNKDCGIVYRILFHAYADTPIFKLARKVERLRKRPAKRGLQEYRQIVRCDKVESVPVRCIEVDSDDHCYLATRGFIATHNSSLTSGVALYCLCADGEQGAEVYSFATTRDQAKIVFGDAKVMAEGNPALRKAFGVEVLANAVVRKATNSTFQAKSAEGSTLDGLNTHLACVDELHAHKTRAVYDVVETSLGKRRQSLMWVITTAGFDLSGICYEVRSMVTAVLSRTVVDENQFGIIYTIDEGDDWKTVEALEKANPNWGISVRPEVIQGLHEKAKFQSSARNNFLTKHLNVWCNASSAWMDMTAWDACGDSSLSVDDFEDSECCIGLDLASKRDIAAKVSIFRKMIDEKDHFFAFPTFYLPESQIQESPNSQYEGWVDDGYLFATPGVTTSFAQIEDDIRMDCSRFDVREVGYDPWQATQLATNLADEGAPMVEVRQTVQNMSEPMKLLEALVLEGRFHHDNNPAYRWMMSNCVAHLDAKENIYPRKERVDAKIDGVVATIIALSRFQSLGDDSSFDDFVNDPLVVNW